MKSPAFLASIVLSLSFMILPARSHAITVVVGANNINEFINGGEVPEPGVHLTGSPTVNLDCPASGDPAPVCISTAAGQARQYTTPEGKTFTISRCSGTGCSSGRARVFVSDGATDRLVLTDALITNTSPGDPTNANLTHSLIIKIQSGAYTEVPAGATLYPYAAELSGSFQGPGASTGNKIEVWAYANNSLIDSPALDPSEGECSPGFPSESCFSIVAPPYKPAGTTQFSPKEYQDQFCGSESESTCVPFLSLVVKLTLKPGVSARLPGSLGAITVNTPSDQGGREKMADIFASLGPKGGEVYRVRLEGSPGSDQTIFFRDTGVQNSSAVWTTRRGSGSDEGDDGEGNVSLTRVRIENNGTGEVRARGLCPIGGCPASNALPVRVYCTSGFSSELTFQTTIHLNHKGDGSADLIPGLPCRDPAVLIMDPFDPDWVAAPMVF